MIETLSNFVNVSSVRDREAVLVDATQNENKMQVWTQEMTYKTNRKMDELCERMNEKLKTAKNAIKFQQEKL